MNEPSSLKERAKLRLSEQRRLDHAYQTFEALCNKHNADERDSHDLYVLYLKLLNLIRNQHIKDVDYKQYKDFKDESISKGDY